MSQDTGRMLRLRRDILDVGKGAGISHPRAIHHPHDLVDSDLLDMLRPHQILAYTQDIGKMPRISGYVTRQAMSEDITSVFKMSQDIPDIEICQGYALTQQPPTTCHISSDVRGVRYGSRHGAFSQSVRYGASNINARSQASLRGHHFVYID